jgi:hypothetical protein
VKKFFSKACTFAVVSVLAVTAHASPLFEIAGGDNGGGANARFTAPGISSAYFNPALLPYVRRSLSFGVLVLQDSVTLTLDGRSGGDIGFELLDSYNEDLTGFDYGTYPTDWIENGCDPALGGECQRAVTARPRQADGTSGVARPYVSVGLVQPIFGRYLVMGVHALIPAGGFTGGDQFFVDEREQFFSNSLHPELLGDRLSAPSIAFALATEPTDGFTLGVGLGVRLKTSAQADTFIIDGNAQSETLQLSTGIDVSIGIAPYVAARYEFGDRAGSLSLTAHSPNRFDVEVGLLTQLADGDVQTATREATLDYMPWQIGFGGEVKMPSREGWHIALTGGVVLRRRCANLDPQGDTPSGDYAWSDTISSSLGARFEHDGTAFGLDASYTPTPVPEQTGRTNYVDSDRYGFNGSVSREVELAGRDLRVGLNGQLNRITQRHHTKADVDTSGAVDPSLVIDEFPDTAVDTRRQEPVDAALGLQSNNPGWPGYGSEGWLWGAGFSVEFLY